MWNRIERLTQPAEEALTLAEVKNTGRVDFNDDDEFFTRCIRAARETVEGPDGAGIVLMASQWTMKLDGFPSEIWIPTGPIMSIDTLSYVDGDGASQVVASGDYQWRKDRFGARIRPSTGKTWPSTHKQFDAVTVTFTAGYPGTDDTPVSRDNLPTPVLHAMRMLIAHWDANRETTIVGVVAAEVQHGFDSLMNMYRVGRVV